MRTATLFSLLVLLATQCLASPIVKRQDSTTVPEPNSEDGDFRNNYHGSQLCEVPGGSGDDTAAIHDAIHRCKSDATILFTPGTNYTLGRPVRFQDLSDVEVRAWGNLVLPSKEAMTASAQNATEGGGGDMKPPWIFVSGDKVVWRGSQKHNGGWVLGSGEEWYKAAQQQGPSTPAVGGNGTSSDTGANSTSSAAPISTSATPGNGTNSNSTSPAVASDGNEAPPDLFAWYLSNSAVTDLKIAHPPGLANLVSGSNVTFANVTIDSAASTPGTHGFNVSGDGMNLSAAVIAVGGHGIGVTGNATQVSVSGVLLSGVSSAGEGSASDSNSTATSASASGQDSGAGSGDGSIGLVIEGVEGSQINNVSFSDITIIDTAHGAHISGPAGSIQDVSFEGVHVANVSVPISVDNKDGTLDIEGAEWRDWRGYLAADSNMTSAVEIDCGDGRCKNFVFENINLVPETGAVKVKCSGLDDASSSPELGMLCTNRPLTEVAPGSSQNGQGGQTGGAGGPGAAGGAGGSGGGGASGSAAPGGAGASATGGAQSGAPGAPAPAATAGESSAPGASASGTPGVLGTAPAESASAVPSGSAAPSSSGSEAPSGFPEPSGSAIGSETSTSSKTPTPSGSVSGSETPTVSPSPSGSETPTPSKSGSSTPVPSGTSTPTPSGSETPTPSDTASGSQTPSGTPSASETPTGSETPASPTSSEAAPTSQAPSSTSVQ